MNYVIVGRKEIRKNARGELHNDFGLWALDGIIWDVVSIDLKLAQNQGDILEIIGRKIKQIIDEKPDFGLANFMFYQEQKEF